MDTIEVELIDRAEIKDGQAVVAYSRTQAAVADLRQRYQGARYDLTTTAGDKAARAARLELVTVRTSLEKKRKELKAPAVEFGKRVDSEAARLTAELVALETPIDAQIKADEKRRDDERRAREEAEAARKKVHTDAIAKIAGYVALAAELGSERIASGIAFLEGLDLSGFEEYTTEATETRDRTLAALRALQVKAKAREDEEARLQAERAEQARVAAEQAEAARQIQAELLEIGRQRAELKAAQEAAAREQQEREAAEAERRRQEEWLAGAEDRERARQAEMAAAVLQQRPADSPAPTDNVHPMPTRAPAAPATPPTLRLGQINERLKHCKVTADDLAALGFPAAGRDRAAVLFHEADFPRICDALMQCIGTARDQQEAA